MMEKTYLWHGAQQTLRSACASAPSDLCLLAALWISRIQGLYMWISDWFDILWLRHILLILCVTWGSFVTSTHWLNLHCLTWKHTCSNMLKISPPKTESFQIKFRYFFIFLLKNIGCGYSLELPHWGCSNAYPQSIFLSRNKKKLYIPVNPSFTI